MEFYKSIRSFDRLSTRVRQMLTSENAKQLMHLPGDTPPGPLRDISALVRPPSRPSDADHDVYPWENLCFEGGGVKGYAYIGAIAALEDAGIYPDQIRRVAGTSVGSMIGLCAVLGLSSEEMIERIPRDLQHLINDGPGGKVGGAFYAARTRGMNPGLRAFEYAGNLLNDYAGSPDITFEQLLERFGREFCVPVTNVTRMMTEYCHPKTSPNMPVRVAVRMSMSLPLLLQPVLLRMRSGDGSPGAAEIYVDGGLLCNNPTHAFDGWWLSMAHEDAFLRRLRPLANASEHYSRAARFSPANPKSLGFTLFAADESDITAAWVRPGGGAPERADTPTARAFAEKEAIVADQSRSAEPLQRLVDGLADFDTDADGRIELDELAKALAAGGLTDAEMFAIFGDKTTEQIFDELDTDDSGYIDFDELLRFLESRDVDVTTQLVGFPARQPKTVLDFALNMLEAVSRDLTRANHTGEDRARTVPIATDYIGTQSFDLVQDDFDFMIESGRRATEAFLAEFDAMSGDRAS